MVRGRRARTVNSASGGLSSVVALSDAVNGSQLFDDQYCASPKRKDLKIEDGRTNNNSTGCRTKTRSQTIKNYFKSSNSEQQTSPNVRISNDNGIELPFDVPGADEEDSRDGINGFLMAACRKSSNASENIFLQEPVLSLNVDKSPNQASSIKINKMIEVEPVFSGAANLNGQFNKIVSLNHSISPKRETVNGTYSLLNIDNNSCDSGVVIDSKLELSPSRRRKPTTPHRILCPSPIKHSNIELTRIGNFASPTASARNISQNNNCSETTASDCLGASNEQQKRHLKSRRRLNQHENQSSITAPQLIGGITLTNETHKQSLFNNTPNKTILNSAKNPTAQQNTTNNFKVIKPKRNGQTQAVSQQKIKNLQPSSAPGNRELTEFFPVRRSVRKTKTAVKEEMLRSLERAVIEERAEGLKQIFHFEGKGRGVVADRVFKRGEFVVEYIGDLIDMTEANRREKKYSLDENAGCYMYYFKHKNQQYCIDATVESGKLGRLVNHSRNGNLITKIVVVKNRPHLVLIAKDDIQPGEELTYDYGDRSKEALLHHPWLAL